MNGPVTPTMVRKSSTLGASASSADRASDNHPPSNNTNTVSNTAFFTMDSLLCGLGRGVAGKTLPLHIQSYRLSNGSGSDDSQISTEFDINETIAGQTCSYRAHDGSAVL